MNILIGALFGFMAFFFSSADFKTAINQAIPHHRRGEWVAQSGENKTVPNNWAYRACDSGLFIVNRFFKYRF